MSSLSELLAFLVTTLQESSQCRSVRVLETHPFSASQFALKVRANLFSGAVLQIRLYHNSGHFDYSYQLLRAGQPLLRWDNKEHFPDIPTFPHHFHAPTGEVQPSSLSGRPTTDLPQVLEFLRSPAADGWETGEHDSLDPPVAGMS